MTRVGAIRIKRRAGVELVGSSVQGVWSGRSGTKHCPAAEGKRCPRKGGVHNEELRGERDSLEEEPGLTPAAGSMLFPMVTAQQLFCVCSEKHANRVSGYRTFIIDSFFYDSWMRVGKNHFFLSPSSPCTQYQPLMKGPICHIPGVVRHRPFGTLCIGQL